MKYLLSIFSFLLFLSICSYGQIINVPGDQPTIQSAINASVDGDTVLVSDGTYFENINFRGKAITLASHFLIDGDKAHIDNTIINGSQPTHPDSGAVVSFISGEDTTSVLHGFTIIGGKGGKDPHGYGIYGGGGIGLNFSGGKIQYNKITDNTVSHNSSLVGGGIVIDAPNNHVLILNNTITNNKLISSVLNIEGGAGICCYNSKDRIIIAENEISNNEVLTSTGGYTGHGGGIYLKDSKAQIRNNLIKNNRSSYGGGISTDNSYPGYVTTDFLNNTIVNNEASSRGGGLYVDPGGETPKMINSILWGNTAPTDPQLDNNNISIEYSNVEGGFNGHGNIDLDPEFSDTVNYYLSSNSPCVDAGFPLTMYYDVEDLNNPSTPLSPALGGLRNDMGAYGGNPNMVFAELPEYIVDLKVDEDTNFVPDRLNELITTTGVVASINFQKSSGNLGYYIQDETSGIYVFADNDDSTNFDLGDWVEVTGKVKHYAGLTEIEVSNTETNLILLEKDHPLTPQKLYIDELLKNSEQYEGMLVRINALKKSTGEWPTSNTGTNIEITDGYKTFTLRLDDDTDMGSNSEPVYPMDLVGIVSQYTSSAPANDGYQLLLNSYSDIEQNVQAAPSPYFFYTPDTKVWENSTYVIAGQPWIAYIDWYPAIDLNGDNLTYEVIVIRDRDGVIISQGPSDNGGTARRSSKTNAWLIGFIQEFGDNNKLTGSWVIRVTDGNTGFVASVDTLKNFTLEDKMTPVDVDEELSTLPNEFALNQNYPNPFNPSTTIKYAIPSTIGTGRNSSEQSVQLIVYDITAEK